MKPLKQDFLKYFEMFEAMYDKAVQAAFDGPAPLAGLKGASIYSPACLTASATAGYELEISPAEAVGLMTVIEAYAFTAKHGSMSRALRPSIRDRARDHDSMLKAVSPVVIHLQKQPIINAFMERVTYHLQKDLGSRP